MCNPAPMPTVEGPQGVVCNMPFISAPPCNDDIGVGCPCESKD